MIIFKKIPVLLKLKYTDMLLLSEVFFLLGMARIVMFFPFSLYSKVLGRYMEETSSTNQLSSLEIQQLKNIKHAIEIVSKYTFWKSKCLVKAITAMFMLKRRGIESTLYLGTAKEEGGLTAHAWLRSGDFYVTGADVMKKFTVVAKFAKKNGGEYYGRSI